MVYTWYMPTIYLVGVPDGASGKGGCGTHSSSSFATESSLRVGRMCRVARARPELESEPESASADLPAAHHRTGPGRERAGRSAARACLDRSK